MKNVILGMALITFAFGCKSNSNTSVTDPAGANMPKAECSKGCEGAKCDGAKAGATCPGQQKACCEKDAKPQG